MNQSTPQQPDPQQTSEQNIMSQNYNDQILKKKWVKCRLHSNPSLFFFVNLHSLSKKKEGPPWMHLCFFCEDFCCRGALWGANPPPPNGPNHFHKGTSFPSNSLRDCDTWITSQSGTTSFRGRVVLVMESVGKSRTKMWEFGNHPYYSHKNFFWMIGPWRYP